MMTSHVENYLHEQMPQVKYIKIVLDDEHLHKIGPYFIRQGHVIMSRKIVYTVLFDFSEMSNAHQSDQVSPPLKSGYLKRIFGCDNLMQQFCPDNHLFIKYTPYNDFQSLFSSRVQLTDLPLLRGKVLNGGLLSYGNILEHHIKGNTISRGTLYQEEHHIKGNTISRGTPYQGEHYIKRNIISRGIPYQGGNYIKWKPYQSPYQEKTYFNTI
ncbi:hypothetical protein Btru_011086 [Bulinus truncatus]|nr:hypothetical protein Btru_011086 [Bulinus truncatus]